jgi:hypothetical protein
MDELTKIRRVIEKQAPISEVLLVLDATTGQNGVMQAEAFLEHAGVTGLVITKLDGSAKGGFVLAVQERTGIPVKLLGQGEGSATSPASRRTCSRRSSTDRAAVAHGRQGGCIGSWRSSTTTSDCWSPGPTDPSSGPRRSTSATSG